MERETYINQELLASQEPKSEEFYAVVKDLDHGYEFDTKLTKRTISIGSDTYDYLEAEKWMSMGTWMPTEDKDTGWAIEGQEGDLVVLHSQVQNALNTPGEDYYFYAVLLHEFGHKNHHHTTKSEKSSAEREVEAFEWAMEKIIDSYLDQPWAENAFDYLAEGRDEHHQMIK